MSIFEASLRLQIDCETLDFPDKAQSYRDKLKQGSDPIYKRLESLYPDREELDEAISDLSEALSAHENVYMELGMKAEARLLHQLLLTDDKIYPPPYHHKTEP